MKNIIHINGVPITIEMNKIGMIKSIYVNNFIIDVINMSKEQIELWTGGEELNGRFWLNVFHEIDGITSQGPTTKSVDSFHGHNYNIDEAILSLL